MVRLLSSPPAGMAETADHFLSMAGYLTEQATTLPDTATAGPAAMLRTMVKAAPAARPDQDRAPSRNGKVKLASPFIGAIGPREILSTLGELGGHLAGTPHVVLEESSRLLREWGEALTGRIPVEIPKGDRRFQDIAWTNNPFHRMSMSGYLAWSTAVNRIIDRAGAGEDATERMRYVASLFTDALSPDNTLIGNPAALKAALDTGGRSLVDGMRNMLEDLSSNSGTPSQVDKTAFSVGGNLAATEGAVVFRNQVLELIQYAPRTAEVFTIPIMMVPPVVNKYYMMDIAPDRSLVQFLVEKGFQTFMISWRNPQPRHGHWGLDEYVAAMLEAMAAIRAITGCFDINTFTVCTGAVPLTALLGHIAGRKLGGVNSATMVVSVLDSNEGRSLGLFATPQAIAEAKRKSAAKGILDGDEMAKVFTWMRPRDLVWNYWVNNYLLGRQPPALDILYWNNDPTRLTARMHAQLLDVFSQDLLCTPGGLTVLGTPIDLSTIDYDTYLVGGITDHISVWTGVYNSARLFGGRFEFVLHSSGHVQSVINPPGTPKAKYYVNPETPDDPEQWLAGAKAMPDSWWLHWAGWLERHSGDRHPAPAAAGDADHPVLAAAPGTYVIEK
ncbi:alpha/beta fold hydrolase [Magnetospirillum sp. SS-4]|uniref:alpha/beta fold hydrolase n=1 Tax=Magnetospirillum sp. SS-4 TaxID=2681465 RepID=UPI001C2D167F|nr:alpha/beta fold hydrolase [Magnetospirillum sp. SS-4]